jgi:hypothetical protein
LCSIKYIFSSSNFTPEKGSLFVSKKMCHFPYLLDFLKKIEKNPRYSNFYRKRILFKKDEGRVSRILPVKKIMYGMQPFTFPSKQGKESSGTGISCKSVISLSLNSLSVLCYRGGYMWRVVWFRPFGCFEWFGKQLLTKKNINWFWIQISNCVLLFTWSADNKDKKSKQPWSNRRSLFSGFLMIYRTIEWQVVKTTGS